MGWILRSPQDTNRKPGTLYNFSSSAECIIAGCSFPHAACFTGLGTFLAVCFVNESEPGCASPDTCLAAGAKRALREKPQFSNVPAPAPVVLVYDVFGI